MLSNRAWGAVLPLASGVGDRPLVGVADNGRAVVVGEFLGSGPGAGPFVVLGTPGGGAAPVWSPPQALAAFGTRSGAPVPSDLRATALRVAPNGRAVLLATGSGGGCPATLPGALTSCRFVSVLDPAQRSWSPWDVMAPLEQSQRADNFGLAINERGDLALLFPANGGIDPVARVFWRGASELAFRSQALGGSAAAIGPQAGTVTLDEAGGLVVAAALNQNATTDVVVWRGSVATGPGAPQVVDTRASPATFRSLWTGRSGRSFLLWTQNNGTTNTLWAARFDRDSSVPVVEDLGATLLETLPAQLRATVSDADELIALRYNGRPPLSTCATWRWPFAGAPQLLDANGACRVDAGVFNPFGDGWSLERNGNLLFVSDAFTWASYDAALNRQIAAPIDVLAAASGPGYVIGVRRPQGIRVAQTALSRSGIGLTVITATIDTWPTPASPLGDGRPGVVNLWATYAE